MKFSLRGIAVQTSILLACASLPAFAQTSVSVKFTGGYSTVWGNSSGEYGAGIYSGDINGTPSASGIICDDFKDEIYNGESWTANAFQVSTLVSSGNLDNTMFGSTIGVTGYAEVATLVSMMFSGTTTYGSLTGITQAELASAIWYLTAPGGIPGLDSTATALVAAVEAAFSGNVSAAESYLSTLTNLWILTPTPLGPGEPQEMWTESLSVPEGGAASLYLLLAMLTCGCGFFARARARVKAPVRVKA
jgi:hypothetical protein